MPANAEAQSSRLAPSTRSTRVVNCGRMKSVVEDVHPSPSSEGGILDCLQIELGALTYGPDRFFESIDGDVGFIFRNDQRRSDTDRARTAAEEKNSVFERVLNNPVALSARVFLRLLVFNDLDS